MKKLLVLFVSAALVFSLAAVSMAAATVNGDFKYNMYEDDTKSPKHYSDTDLYVKVSGDVSDSVYAMAKFEFKKTNSDDDVNTAIDEFYATVKEDWGTVKMGYYEYEFTPSRVNLKSAGFHVLPKCDATFEVNIPVAEGITLEGVVEPYKNSDETADDGTYGVALNYKAENWGAKVSYVDLKLDRDVKAIDVYYMVNDNVKVFVDAVDYSEVDKVAAGTIAKYEDGFDPIIGVAWSNVAETPLYLAFEYALNDRTDKDTGKDYQDYYITAKYQLTNKIWLELYHELKGDDKTKDKFRIRYKF
jgi:hypothetical protein